MNLDQVHYVILNDELDAEARLHGLKIGYVNCIKRDARLQLADIRIDHVSRRRPTFLERLRSLIGVPRLPELRHRGIGSELLKTVLRAADSAGIHEIWGCVTHEDLATQPRLLGWYERHGFIVQEPDEECVTGTVKKIVRRQ